MTLLPQVGGNDIESVLSEGEQRLHALALFFAELNSCCQSVLVFDDPVSSFDYNNIANSSCRLRDVAVKCPNRQDHRPNPQLGVLCPTADNPPSSSP